MDEVMLDENVPNQDLKQFEKLYHEQLARGSVSDQTQFEYASCLVRSQYGADIKKGLLLLEELFRSGESGGKRDYLYYIAIGYARLKEYSNSLRYLKVLIDAEPNNRQAISLQKVVKERMRSDGIKGLTIAGGAVVGVAAILGLAIGLARK